MQEQTANEVEMPMCRATKVVQTSLTDANIDEWLADKSNIVRLVVNLGHCALVHAADVDSGLGR
jgi:hypothetical protein